MQGKCYQAECKLNANKTVVYLDVVRGGKIKIKKHYDKNNNSGML